MNSSSVVAKSSSVARRLRRLSSTLSTGAIPTRQHTTTIIPAIHSSSSSSSSSSSIHNNSIHNNNNNSNNIGDTRRWFGSGGGSRGARGHGWWLNYRAGKGGRHLQGTYSHLDIDAMEEWNEAVFGMGSTMVYLDVALEALAGSEVDDSQQNQDQQNENQQQVHRLTLELATEAMPLATENVLKLLQTQIQTNNNGNNNNDDDKTETTTEIAHGYHATTLHRIEKGVGILGGLVDANPNHQSLNTNTNGVSPSKQKIGRCHPSFRMTTSPTSMDISSEHLVLNHTEGVVTMLQPRIGEIDSRFLVLSHNAPHLDGVSVAVGRLATPESLRSIQTWESSLITSHGVPTNATLRVVGCGLLESPPTNENQNETVTKEEDATERVAVAVAASS